MLLEEENLLLLARIPARDCLQGMVPVRHWVVRKSDPQREFLCQDSVLDSYKVGAANLS